MGRDSGEINDHNVGRLPALRHLLVLALAVWLPLMDPVEPMDFWTDDHLFQAVCVRLSFCPRCRSKAGKACIGVGALRGQKLRLHHIPRTLIAKRICPRIPNSWPVIPFVIKTGFEVPKNKKRADARR